MNATTQNRENLTQDVQFVKGVGPQRARLLQKIGIRTLADLAFHFPTRYEDFAGQSKISELQINQTAAVTGIVDDIDETKKDGQHILYVLLKQDSGYLRGIWFNQEYLLAKFRFGQTVQFRGKVTERGGRLQMTHPVATWIDVEPGGAGPEEQLLPVYRLTSGINQRKMREMVAQAVEDAVPLLDEALPEEIRKQFGLPGIADAITSIHGPQDESEMQLARSRLAFQELLVLQLALAMRRQRLRTNGVAPQLEMTARIRARMLGRLPFELRPSQLAALDEIAADMSKNVPMNRLLHGETGSGKTVVAACAMLLAAAHGHQAALMVPTEILAVQHYRSLKKLLAGSRLRLDLKTASLHQRENNSAAEEDAEPDLVVGTTALLSEKQNFRKLGLVVIDEQHKFGVRQRASLKAAGFDPHYLIMTATPIPRTICMTLFGDLDVSTLRDESSRATRIKTYIGKPETRERWWEFFRGKLQQGRQGFVVAPNVEAKANSGVHGAEQLLESLVNGPLEAFRLGLVHGRIESEEKQDIMDRFAAGETQVLVATGVVETGIDVPNATVMTIESAERFGLSQLHQLRGRVGRGQHQGYVCAFASDHQASEIERLQAFESCTDGFELAQIDLQLRGPGNLLSTRQTGFPPLRIADIVRDHELLSAAQKLAREIMEVDSDLAGKQYSRLRKLVLARYGPTLDLGDVG